MRGGAHRDLRRRLLPDARRAGHRTGRLHLWEEPVLSGTRGSGAVFFSGCSLGCVYCQNHTISAEGVGKAVTTERLREIFRELIAQGAHNIDLITASHFVPFLLPRWRSLCRCRWCSTAAATSGWRRCVCWKEKCRSGAGPEVRG